MAFNNTALQSNPDLPAGEVITASPYNVSAFERFEDGLIEAASANMTPDELTTWTRQVPRLSRVS